MPMSILRFKSESDIPAHIQARMRGTPPVKQDEPKPAPCIPSKADRDAPGGSGGGINEAAHKQKGRVVSKYRAVKTVVDGTTFDSKAEAKRYQELRNMAHAAIIWDLELQPVYVLAPSVVVNGRRRPALRYKADFAYKTLIGEKVIEDVKGVITDAYRIKRHLMKAVLGLDIVEITK